MSKLQPIERNVASLSWEAVTKKLVNRRLDQKGGMAFVLLIFEPLRALVCDHVHIASQV